MVFATTSGEVLVDRIPPNQHPIPRSSMKKFRLVLATVLVAVASPSLQAQRSETPELVSTVYDWEKMEVEDIPNGVRRYLFDGPTGSLDNLHMHITTLDKGEVSGPPNLHLQEEILIVKEGRVELHCDGELTEMGAGSVMYLASNAVTRLRNIGDGVATYYVIYWYTPKTPKS